MVASIADVLIEQAAPLRLLSGVAVALTAGWLGFFALSRVREAAHVERAAWIALAVLSLGLSVWCAQTAPALAGAASLAAGAALAAAALRGRARTDVVVAVVVAAAALMSQSAVIAGAGGLVAVAIALAGFGGAVVAVWLALKLWRRGVGSLAAATAFAGGVGWLQATALAAAARGGEVPRAVVEPGVLLGAAALTGLTMLALHLRLRAERRRPPVAAVAAAFEDGAALATPAGRLSWVNPALRGMMGLEADATPCVDDLLNFLSSRDAPGACPTIGAALRRDLDAAIRRGARFSGDIVIRSETAANRILKAVIDQVGERKAAMILLRDVTDERDREAKLAAARDEAEALSRAKTQLLAVASHEMRTPLHGVLGLSELLGRDVRNPRSKAMLDALKITVHQIDAVLADMLEYTEGAASFKPETCAPTDFVATLEAQFAAVAAEKGLTFSVSVDDALGDAIHIDERALSRALGRLIDNAVKFTAKGGVSVALRRGGWNERPAVICEVRDSGPGVDEGVLSAALAGFAQADASTTRAHSGLGLGLALTQRAVAAMRGVLRVSSDETGSCFSIVLPGATETGRDAAFYSRDIA